MNPKKMLKRLIGVALLVFVLCFSFSVLAKSVNPDDGSGNTPTTDTGTGNNTTGNNTTGNNSTNSQTKDPVVVVPYSKCGQKSCTKGSESTVVVNKYGLQLTYSKGQFKVEMLKSVKDGVYFTIAKINGYAAPADVASKKIEYLHPVTFTAKGTYDDPDSGLEGVLVELKSSDCVYNSMSSCYWDHLEATMFTTDGVLEPVFSEVSYKIGSLVDANYLAYTIDCTNNTVRANGTTQTIKRGSGSFEDKFCYAKEHASKKYSSGISNRNNDELITFKCDYKLESIPANESTLVGDKYFTNKQYLYGVSTYSESTNLVYHYTPSYENKNTTISCDVTCEEAVEVEYGPPVASAAGMCFEYKVRVTSRVSCNMSKAPSSADLCKSQICSPRPQCYHSGGEVYEQAGPNTDFDSCVKKCDGGIYSKKCSTSCYKKVYGDISAYAKTNGVYYDEVFGIKLSRNYNKGVNAWKQRDLAGCVGYYDRRNDSTTSDWYGKNETIPGRWYCANGWAYKPGKGYQYYKFFYGDKDGFFRKYYDNWRPCDADCKWEECPGDIYLNNYVPCNTVMTKDSDDWKKYCITSGEYEGYVNILEYDCAKNQERYNNLVKQCQSMASCSTTQAEFTISASYTKLGQTKETTINFPYNSNADYLKHGNPVSSSQTSKTSTLLPDYPEKDQGILGCYQTGGDKNLYRSTWGFPGSWRNLKTNEVSYDPAVDKENQGSADGGGNKSIWFAFPGKFCIPGDAKNINGAWWNAYKHRQLVNTGVISDLSVSQDAELGAQCIGEGSVMNPPANYAPEKYNIKAHAKDFGYFGWDIDIECFYAINDNALNTDNSECIDSSVTAEVQGEAYRVRSTDLENLFPAADGSDLASPDTAGRKPGFNWSEYAVNTKNTDYKSNPVKYMQALQEAAKKAKDGSVEMYTNDNLDYQFYLTPKVLREMRKDKAGSGGSNYTAFSDSGFTLDNNGVGRYYSKKIRNLGSDNKLPLNNDSLYCNNMVNWQTPGCDTIHND